MQPKAGSCTSSFCSPCRWCTSKWTPKTPQLSPSRSPCWRRSTTSTNAKSSWRFCGLQAARSTSCPPQQPQNDWASSSTKVRLRFTTAGTATSTPTAKRAELATTKKTRSSPQWAATPLRTNWSSSTRRTAQRTR